MQQLACHTNSYNNVLPNCKSFQCKARAVGKKYCWEGDISALESKIALHFMRPQHCAFEFQARQQTCHKIWLSMCLCFESFCSWMYSWHEKFTDRGIREKPEYFCSLVSGFPTCTSTGKQHWAVLFYWLRSQTARKFNVFPDPAARELSMSTVHTMLRHIKLPNFPPHHGHMELH